MKLSNYTSATATIAACRPLTRNNSQEMSLVKNALTGIGTGCSVLNFAIPSNPVTDLPKLGAVFGMTVRVIDNETKMTGFAKSYQLCQLAIQTGAGQQEAAYEFLKTGVSCGAHFGTMVKCLIVLTGGAVPLWLTLAVTLLGVPDKVSKLKKAQEEVETMKQLDSLFKKGSPN